MSLPGEPARLELARAPTPLEHFPRLDERLWVKRDDLTGMGLSGNKVRKLEYLLADARAKGADAVVTCGGVQSNHARATAIAAAQLGLACTLVLRDPGRGAPALEGNLLLDRLAGARVRFVTREEYAARREALLEEEVARFAAEGRRGYAITEGGSDAVGSWGYARALAEALEQARALGVTFDAVTFATGSGGTAAGLAAGKRLLGSAVELVGFCVCDDAAFFERKVTGILAAMRLPAGAVRFDDRYKGPGYAVPDEPTLETIVRAGRVGLLLDPVYTGKAFTGTLAELAKGALGRRVLFIHTGGLFGTLAQSAALAPYLGAS